MNKVSCPKIVKYPKLRNRRDSLINRARKAQSSPNTFDTNERRQIVELSYPIGFNRSLNCTACSFVFDSYRIFECRRTVFRIELEAFLVFLREFLCNPSGPIFTKTKHRILVNSLGRKELGTIVESPYLVGSDGIRIRMDF